MVRGRRLKGVAENGLIFGENRQRRRFLVESGGKSAFGEVVNNQ
jgi:hypothetical protein